MQCAAYAPSGNTLWLLAQHISPLHAAVSLPPAVRELAARVQAASPIGQYAAPLAAVKLLVSIEPIAKALVGLATFKPDLKAGTGRALQLPGSSWLGPCFSVSAYPDDLIKSEPDVGAACFRGALWGERSQVCHTTCALCLFYTLEFACSVVLRPLAIAPAIAHVLCSTTPYAPFILSSGSPSGPVASSPPTHQPACPPSPVPPNTLCQGDLVRHMNTLHLASKHITGELHAIVKSLLGKATREDMISWLANTLNGNKERAKMQADLKVSGRVCVWPLVPVASIY